MTRGRHIRFDRTTFRPDTEKKRWNPMPGNFFLRILILSVLAFACPLHAADPAPFGPWDDKPAQQGVEDRKSAGFPGSLLIGCVRFYQDSIAPVIGADCPSYPSCSAYGIEAIRKHGFFLGILMTADRLLHESDEIGLGPVIEVGDQLKVDDPVENNDFWWTDRKK